MLRVSQVSKAYRDVVALRGVDLDVPAGEVVALLGTNGAGKSTLLSIVAGLTRPDGGTCTAGGPVGFAPQDLGVYPTLTVAENLRFFARLAGLWGARAKRRIDQVAGPLGLAPLLDRPARALSGGEQRRLHVAIALVPEPPVVLLDEPTVGMDVVSRIALVELVRGLADAGVAVCYSSHYLAEVEELGGPTVILDRGRVVARGTVRELLRDHGESRVDLTFTGPAPDIALPWPTRREERTVRIVTDSPQITAVRAINELGEAAQRLQSVEIRPASLESVFLNVTASETSETSDELNASAESAASNEPDGVASDA
ncbi:Daunorubicin/doxorubicin resistance ATP-binding protein DrrA [Streptomyces sp. MP131-18]|nr:Daunorubicin/doxorubicin resistance ATP-binding protein DrrA [Streptomyces sp. MP131-18]